MGEFESKFEEFLKKWIPDSYPHLIDTDENDDQELRDCVNKDVAQAKLDRTQEIIKLLYAFEDAKVISSKVVELIEIKYPELKRGAENE